MEHIILKRVIEHTMSSRPKGKTCKNIGEEKPKEGWSLYRGDTELGHRINDMINGAPYAIISTLIMLYSLFSDDVRQLCFPHSADLPFSILTLICMIYYSLEIAVFCVFQRDYFLKYYFWLDLLSTLTMAFDLIWVTQYITGGGKSAANISQITKASRAARLGTRTVRLIRLIRMVKILRQMKSLSKDLMKKQAEAGPKKLSQRLSSIHSKLASLRNIERLASIRHMEKLSSKRWSLIKETGCMQQNLHAHKPELISIACLPFREQDQVIDREELAKSEGRPLQVKKMESIKKIGDIKKVQLITGEGKVTILDQIVQEVKQQVKVQDIYRSKKSRFDLTVKRIESTSDNDIPAPIETKVGSKVQDQIQKNVILMIILILISIPLLDASTWLNPVTIYDTSLQQLIYIAESLPSYYQSAANNYISYGRGEFLNRLVYFNISTGSITDNFPDNYEAYEGTINSILDSTRAEDLNIVVDGRYTVAYDILWYNQLTSIFNIARTFFVCILLIFTTMFFSNDLEFAAIAPLEEMFDTVRKIAIHPLNALKEIEERNMCMEAIEEEKNEVIQNTEPKILLNTIVKIGSLLAIGFGEAGAEIICRVIEDPSIINVMIPGQKIMALFGFCDIRNFTDATEVLQADVMVFVNEIAHICHKVVYEHMGSPNKNIGDAFLLVWKFAQEDYNITETDQEMKIELVESDRVRQLADLAVLALVKMIAEITKSQALQKYKENRGLQQRIPNYAGVKMGFGLHVGWAIEGPIGSEYKIDASYLSPHVHMSSRLQAATKGYGTSMLITGAVYDLMTHNRSNLRQIDRVIPTGETDQMNLYTIDIIPKHLFEELGVKEQKKMTEKQKRKAKVCENMNRKKLSEDIQKERATDGLWNDEDVKIMQELYTRRFYEEWSKGFQNYLTGNWEAALAYLNVARGYAPFGVDGPSQSLIGYIEQHNGHAPQNWAGYRDFD